MIKFTKRQSIKFSAMVMTGLMTGAMDANAQLTMVDTVGNIGTSSAQLPGLVTGTAYIMGTVIGTLGILKIKDHVENPSGTPLKEGAIRLLTGGALLTVPTILDVVQTTMDGSATGGVTNADNIVDGADFTAN